MEPDVIAAESPAVREVLREFVFANAGISSLYLRDPIDRIGLVRAGLPATSVSVMSKDLGITKESLYELLGVTRATASHKVRGKVTLSSSATERMVFVAELVKLVEEMIPNERAADFDAAKWAVRWLEAPQPVLGGKDPKTFLDTADGRDIVRRLLGKVFSAAYA